jgi:hypothetical protein
VNALTPAAAKPPATGATSTGAPEVETPPPSPAAKPTSPAARPGAALVNVSDAGKIPPRLGSQGQRVYGGPPSRAIELPTSERAIGGPAAFQGAAIILSVATAKLDAIGKEIQNDDARTKLLSTRQEIIDVLHREPGVGAVVEVQFLEPEHRFQDIYWHRTTDAYAGKPTVVANVEARQPTSTFIYVEPMRPAKPGEKEGGAPPAASAPKEVKNGKEFIEAYMQARGADFSGAGTIAIEMYDAIQRGNHQFGYTDVGAGVETIRVWDAVRASIEQQVASLAERPTRSKLARLKRGIDTQQARLSEKLKDWKVGPFGGGSIKLTGHELDPARAHYAAAEHYTNDKKFGPAVESINAGEAQVEEIWAALYEYDHGHRPIAPPI